MARGRYRSRPCVRRPARCRCCSASSGWTPTGSSTEFGAAVLLGQPGRSSSSSAGCSSRSCPGTPCCSRWGCSSPASRSTCSPGTPLVELVVAILAAHGRGVRSATSSATRSAARIGPPLYERDGRILKRKYFDQTTAFFDKHGNKALVIGRFVPFVRTYITVVAGVTRMERRRFFLWSPVGAVAVGRQHHAARLLPRRARSRHSARTSTRRSW